MRTTSSISTDRVWHPYTEWEDYKSGMYKTPKQLTAETGIDSEDRVSAAIECLTSESLLSMFMRKVVDSWPIATEHVLTGNERRVSWLGQCACFMWGGCSDEETRKAWGMLNEKDRETANGIARSVISEWEGRREKEAWKERV